MPSHDVAGYQLRGLIEGLRALHVDVDRVLEDSGIEQTLLADPEARFEAGQVLMLWLHAEQHYARRSFGFDLATHIPFGELELSDFLIAGCPTLGAGIECLAHQARLSASGFSFALEDHVHERVAGRRIFADHAQPFGAFPKSMSEYNWTLLVSRLRHACGAAFRPVLWLRELPDVPSEVLFAALGTLPEVADEEALFVPDAQWTLENVRRDPLLRQLMQVDTSQAEAQNEFLSALHSTIASAMHRGDPSIARVATRLGFTPRSLQRRLEQEGNGLSFQQVLDALRHDLARQYLACSQLAITEISGLLAYSDVAAFERAFRRWTGRTPAEQRKQLQAAAE